MPKLGRVVILWQPPPDLPHRLDIESAVVDKSLPVIRIQYRGLAKVPGGVWDAVLAEQSLAIRVLCLVLGKMKVETKVFEASWQARRHRQHHRVLPALWR